MSETLALEAKSGKKTHARSLVKGLLAGLIGGLAATAAKTVAEKMFPPRTHGEPEPPSMLVEKIFGSRLEGAQKLAAAETIHWGLAQRLVRRMARWRSFIRRLQRRMVQRLVWR